MAVLIAESSQVKSLIDAVAICNRSGPIACFSPDGLSVALLTRAFFIVFQNQNIIVQRYLSLIFLLTKFYNRAKFHPPTAREACSRINLKRRLS